LIACGCLAGGAALAQGQGQQQGAGAGAQGEGEMLGPKEQEAIAASVLRKGTALSKRVSQLLNDARKENDVIKVTCLNAKLTQINANLRNAQRHAEALANAAEVGQVQHELTVLGVIGEKLDTLEKEAAQCVGQDLYETGQTRVITEIDTSMLPFEDNPTVPPPPGFSSLPTLPPPATGRR
jgi:hypothetical protein